MFKSLLEKLDHTFPMICVLVFICSIIAFSVAISVDEIMGMYQLK